MFPPWQSAIWRSLAHAGQPAGFVFASSRSFAQGEAKALAQGASGPFCDDCYPSPYPWPGPTWVRPFLAGKFGRRSADLVSAATLRFHLLLNTVASAPIKTIIRGSVTCASKPLSSWHYVRPPLPGVLKTILNVAASVPLAVQSSARQLVLIQLPVRLSAVLAGWCATIWAFAGNPAARALQPFAAIGNLKTVRVSRPDGFFHLRRPQCRALEGRQCSKRY